MRDSFHPIVRFACCLALLSAAAQALAALQSREAAPKPNVVILYPDQWRAQAFGFAGDPNVRTPQLDRLAGESVRFLNAVAGTPVCCPSRATFLTGRLPLSTGVFMNDVPLDPKAVTLGEIMKNAGYATAYIGKWHLDGHGRSSFIPRERRHGFDYWKALECTHDYNRSAYYADGPEKQQWEGYDALAQTRDAIAYLRDRARTGQPFCLMLAWGPPHDPYPIAPERFRRMYTPESLVLGSNVPPEFHATARTLLAGYYAHCSALDECVGLIRGALRESGLDRNTLLLFTSDHGDLLGAHGGRNKQQPYDESIRVPLLVHWPAGLGNSARRLSAPINTEDLLPTLLGFCEIPAPKNTQGHDFSPQLRGARDSSDRAALIACYAPFGQWPRKAGGREYRGLRTERYTYVRDLNGPWLLFDNETDPWQLRNLVNQPAAAAIQLDLERRLAEKLKKCDDQFLPAHEYITRWGYTVDQSGTVPYTP